MVNKDKYLSTGEMVGRNRVKAIAIAAIVLIAVGLVYWPALRWLVNSWLSSDYYSHGILVPVIAGFLAWRKRRSLARERATGIAAALLAAAIVLYVLNFLLEIRVLGAISLLASITSAVFFFSGKNGARQLMFPLGFLLFMVPFPFFTELATGLQRLAVIASAGLLGVFGLPVTVSGSQIFLPQATFSIGLPCSGINSFVALLALGAVYAYMVKGNLYKRFGLWLSAIPIAIAANILRITSIIMVAYYGDMATATGWYHDISSVIFFFMGFGILVLTGWGMGLKLEVREQGKGILKIKNQISKPKVKSKRFKINDL